jgi:hypothetical protein
MRACVGALWALSLGLRFLADRFLALTLVDVDGFAAVLGVVACRSGNACAAKPHAANKTSAVTIETLNVRILFIPNFTDLGGCSSQLRNYPRQKNRQHALVICMTQNLEDHILPRLQWRHQFVIVRRRIDLLMIDLLD